MELSGALFKSKLEKITPPSPLSHQKKNPYIPGNGTFWLKY